MTIVEERTLIEDWRLRREQLRRFTNPRGRAYDDAVARVLDYLIRRYADHPDGKLRAQFMLAPDVYLNERAIVVHSHMGEGKVAGVKSAHEASLRAEKVVQRIAQLDIQKAIADSMGKNPVFAGMEHLTPMEFAATRFSGKHVLRAAIGFVIFVVWMAILVAVTRVFGIIASAAISYSLILVLIIRKKVLHRTIKTKPITLEQIRSNLASTDAATRLGAIRAIASRGTLQDVGLLTDLIQLPTTSAAAIGERKLLIKALEAIVQKKDEALI